MSDDAPVSRAIAQPQGKLYNRSPHLVRAAGATWSSASPERFPSSRPSGRVSVPQEVSSMSRSSLTGRLGAALAAASALAIAACSDVPVQPDAASPAPTSPSLSKAPAEDEV